jgi:hypothetical protein
MVGMAHDLGSEAVELERPRLRGKRRRRSLRRALSLECRVECDAWEGSVAFEASDVSDEGLWLDTPYALQPGEELVVSFPLPGDPDAERVWAIAEVARVGMWRRRQDAYPAGMGLVFTYCSQEDLNRLSNSLYGRPPRLPSAVLTCGGLPAAAPAAPAPRVHEEEPSLPAVLDWLLASE